MNTDLERQYTIIGMNTSLNRALNWAKAAIREENFNVAKRELAEAHKIVAHMDDFTQTSVD